MYLKRLPRWARMEAEHSKGHHFPIVASPINISTPVPSSLYVTQRYPYIIAQNQVSSYNPLRLIQIQCDLLFNTRIIIYTFRKLDFLRMNTGNGEMDSQTDCQFPSEEWTGD